MADKNKKSNRRLLKVEDKKLKEKELIERIEKQKKPPKIFDVIEEIIKTKIEKLYDIKPIMEGKKLKDSSKISGKKIKSGMRRFNRGGKV